MTLLRLSRATFFVCLPLPEEEEEGEEEEEEEGEEDGEDGYKEGEEEEGVAVSFVPEERKWSMERR
jgi:hypothetical protein